MMPTHSRFLAKCWSWCSYLPDEFTADLTLALIALLKEKYSFSAPSPVLVVESVYPQKRLVADIAEHCQPFVVDCYRIEAVAVNNQIVSFLGNVNMLMNNF